jgi:hypothetical protein
MVITSGSRRIAVVGVDLLGVMREDVDWIKRGLPGFANGDVFVCASHTHAGPDLIGLWGYYLLSSGRDRDYLVQLRAAVAAAVAEAALEAKAVVDSEVKVVVDSEAVKDVPVQRALKAKERDAQELKAEKAVDAAEVAQDHPELRVVKEPKKVVMKALSMSKERKELTTKAKSTDSEERRENSGTHMIEKTELAEAEESIREVLERATGELLLMKPRSLKLPRAKKLLRRLPLRARQQLRSKKSMLPLRKKRRLQLRRKRTQSN